jgi:DNA-binding transcriptional LysR family regulator
VDRFEAMRTFLAVAESEGFAVAARRLSMSPAAVTRAVSSLERRIGARLLHRTTRVVRLTEAGQRFLADCRRILTELGEAEASAAGSHAALRGPLSLTAPVLFGQRHVAPTVLDFLKRHPAVTARIFLADRIVDLMEEDVDIAVRLAHLPDSSLTAIRTGAVRNVVCASPDYLTRHGLPRSPADLTRLDLIAFSQDLATPEWSFVDGTGTRTLRPAARLIVNNAEAAIAAAAAGHGLTRVLSYQIAPELRAGRLEIVLAEFEHPPVPVQVVHREGRRPTGRVRALVDFLVERLRADPAIH